MHNSESIILTKRALGEADLLIGFYTKKSGKVRGVARYAKKSKKRFGGVLETGYVIDLHYSQSPGSELLKISQASLISPTVHHASTLGETTSLWFALEMADRFLPDCDANEEKYELLKRFVIACHEGRVKRGILVFFIIRWIALCGYLPDFNDLSAGMSHVNFNMSEGTKNTIKRVVSGDINFDINDRSFEEILKFIFRYSLVLLGRPLKLEDYIPMMMEVGN